METEHDFVVLHFDGKIIKYLRGDTEDRLAIAISVPEFINGQFLASPAIPSGKGLAMSNCLTDVVNEYGFMRKIEALVFDTTASNTGVWSGATTRFEETLCKAIFWLACRHHIPELFVKHANIVVRGKDTKAPEDQLFIKFEKAFTFIDKDLKQTWVWPSRNDWRYQRASDVLEWAEHHMRFNTWPREDYRELLELTVIFLGGIVKRMQFGSFNVIASPIRKPGARHRARFMASCLYLYKIFMFQAQFDVLTPETTSQVAIMTEYIALIHVPYFLKCPIAITAPRQDRDFWIDLLTYKKCFTPGSVQWEMINAVQCNFKNHMWYLSEECVIFGLFDINVSTQERKAMAEKLILQPRPTDFPGGKPIFEPELLTDQPQLISFMGPYSWLLFHKLSANGEWLQRDPDEWDKDEEFKRMQTFLQDLKVVNDLAERCVKDVQDYKDMTKDSKHRDEIIIVATDYRGVIKDTRKKSIAMR